MNSKDQVILPGMMIPSFRVARAVKNGVADKILIKTWGGLGDQVCSEPTLRHAFKVFKNQQISLASEQPDLFTHLPFHEVFDLKKVRPVEDNYMVLNTIVPPSDLLWEFFSHCVTNCVDFASMCALRGQLPIADREIKLVGEAPEWKNDIPPTCIVIHAGKHWPSKTFPKCWWDDVIARIREKDYVPVLIGKETDDNRSTVDVDPTGCIDLRNKTDLKSLIWLLQNVKALVTNDSSPLHIAASGNAQIAFIASCKHWDYISHWRNGIWSWRMKNLGLDGLWNYLDQSPVQNKDVTVEFLPEGLMEKILPPPSEVANYAINCVKQDVN